MRKEKNIKLKLLCIEKCGTQYDAAKAAKMNEAKLSLIINNHITATEKDIALLAKVLGDRAVRDCFASGRH